MTYSPVTPFRRALQPADLKNLAEAEAPLPPEGVNKWEVLRELTTARATYGLTDRDLTVLQGLISFHPATILGGNVEDGLIVYPSNKALCERLNGMACSTMRRHLGNLVRSGFLLRRDSPNGKRYKQRGAGDRAVFGFDLSPLVRRFAAICGAAEELRATQERLERLRTRVSLMRRDLLGLSVYGREMRPDEGLWDVCDDMVALAGRALRRKPDWSDLSGYEAHLESLLDKARGVLEVNGSEIMSTNDADSEQHHQNSNKDSYESELGLEKTKKTDSFRSDCAADEEGGNPKEEIGPPPLEGEDKLPNVPLGLVLSVCHEFKAYCDGPVRHWHHLVASADLLRPMIGISPSAWQEAKTQMGAEEAAVVLVAMLERLSEIRSPGGYLRSLTTKAAAGSFSCGPMIMALMRKEAA